MAQELLTTGPTGFTLDAYIYAVQGDTIYRTDTHVFETPNSTNWAHYFINMTETAGSYVADFPTAIVTAGTYDYVVRYRAGVSASPSDPIYAAGTVNWDGDDEDGTPTITTRDYVKTQNGWTDDTYDAQIDQLLPAVTDGINRYLRRDIVSTLRTEVRNGQGRDWIRVTNPPIQYVNSITFDYNDLNPTTVAGSNFVFDTDSKGGIIKFKRTSTTQYLFHDGFQNIQLVYKGGFAAIPYDIQAAAALVVRKLIELGDDERLVTEKSEGNRKIKYDQAYAAAIGGNFESPVYTEARALLLPHVLVRCF